ncbi:hypothetical protein BD309DRAFT_952205 [Dichomitus squalens]|uniref:F-box domain-containing protein n=1 Tax=Dichomitus squalens TaxID=114155 RepID=A0A4Q9MUE1_9APHY|nr:hypothetical protein BD311DRAFT_751995 [Dichomitus squalens]TBU47290.1 hypothetical protein BD309DRAFT_952205 [Dichomitus squalens]TBU64482.1 hypothetical protein BD310DRAFT_914737 [Dichomitus squalens]
MAIAHAAMFPAEILDHILDHLHDDYKALGACALAGRALLPTSRYHRFNGLYVDRYHAGILQAFLVEAPDLAMSMSALTYQPFSMFRMGYHEDAADVTEDLLRLLPNLTDIRIPAPALPYLAQFRSQLTHLRLFEVWVSTRRELLAGLSLFTELQELELCDPAPWIRSDEDIEDALDPPAPHVRTVSFWNSTCPRIITGWFDSQGITPLLYRAKLTIQARASASAFVHQSCVLAPLAQELEVVFAPNGTMQDALQDTDLTLERYSIIHSCTLRFRFSEMCVAENKSLSWIPKILGQLSSDSLRSLTISLVVDNVEDLRSLMSECAVRVLTTAYFDDMRALDWAAIGQALSSERLRGLRKVVLEGRGSRSLLEDHIRLNCPALHSRRILTLHAVAKSPIWAELRPHPY